MRNDRESKRVRMELVRIIILFVLIYFCLQSLDRILIKHLPEITKQLCTYASYRVPSVSLSIP
jgi:hypothetical protein